MTNHPNRKRLAFEVYGYPGELLGKFACEFQAHRVAQMWSSRWASWTDVIYLGRNKHDDGAGIVGQYRNGEPTAEFQHLKSIQGLRTVVITKPY